MAPQVGLGEETTQRSSSKFFLPSIGVGVREWNPPLLYWLNSD